MGCNEFHLKVHVPVYKDRTKETIATLFDDKNEVRHSNSSLVHNQRQTQAFLIRKSFIFEHSFLRTGYLVNLNV